MTNPLAAQASKDSARRFVKKHYHQLDILTFRRIRHNQNDDLKTIQAMRQGYLIALTEAYYFPTDFKKSYAALEAKIHELGLQISEMIG